MRTRGHPIADAGDHRLGRRLGGPCVVAASPAPPVLREDGKAGG
ncbi:MAG: hypothetical protein WHS89_14535 [Acidimicrobiales bacterium]